VNLTEVQVAKVMQQWDTDADGHISREEFMLFFEVTLAYKVTRSFRSFPPRPTITTRNTLPSYPTPHTTKAYQASTFKVVNESGQQSLASCGGCFLFAICCCIPTLCTSWLCFSCYAKCQSDKFTRDLEDAKKEALLGVSSLVCLRPRYCYCV
jgi:hypothetical protein